MDLAEARQFLTEHHRAILATRRRVFVDRFHGL
ncbi:hypothetical protein NKDENANG_03281 [Candidatus Entotheonellaceae bacterium PAL068K]